MPTLDDVTRRRLIRGASDTNTASNPPPRAARPWAKIVAIAAAGLIVFGGIGVAVSSMNGGRGDSSSESSAIGSATAPPLSGDVGDLGDIANVAGLRSLLDGRESTTAKNDSSANSSKEPAPVAPPSGSAADSATTLPFASGTTAVDPAKCALELAGTDDVIFSGTGTYQGAPVVIIGVGKGGRTIVFVVSSTDCASVLASVSR